MNLNEITKPQLGGIDKIITSTNIGSSYCKYICQYPYDKCEYREIGGTCAADLACGYETVNGINTFKHGSMILSPDENNTIS